MNSRITQLKFVCPCISYYASHYSSQSIALSGQYECRTGWWQPVDCIIIGQHFALLGVPTVDCHYCGLVLSPVYVNKGLTWNLWEFKQMLNIQIKYFIPVNRRLDEWVSDVRVDVFKTSIPEEKLEEKSDNEGPERKLTRNQKRKHDEINHVQKVSI